MGRKKPDRDIINIDKLEIENKIEIDYDKLAQAIVKANLEKENGAKELNKTEENAAQKKAKEILGAKDFSRIKCKTWRNLREFLNGLKVIWKLFSMSREEAEHFSTMYALLKMFTTLLMWIIGAAFYVLAGIILCISYYLNFLFSGILIAFLFVMFAKMIRIARYEIERIDDSIQLMNISMTVISVVTLLFTVVSIFVSSVGGG